MTALFATLLSLSALAASDTDPNWESACRKRCERDGFTMEVLSSTLYTGVKIIFWDGTGVEWIDSAHYQSGDMYVGSQSAGSPLAGGPYCTSYPGAAGHFINGNVYKRLVDASWSYNETSSLSMEPTTACDASIEQLLDLVELYGDGGALPVRCTDIGCASGGGSAGGGGAGGSGTWGYTDASGEEQSFDDLNDDDDGGVVGGGSAGTSREATRRR